jgi:hypothetical protein
MILAYLSADELGQRVTADSFRGTWGPQAPPPASTDSTAASSNKRPRVVSHVPG